MDKNSPGKNKNLYGMSLEELWQLFPIALTEHRNCWAEYYKEELAVLSPLLPAGTLISHIGSTAIEGIWAKPIVDILCEMSEDEDMGLCAEKLAQNGYIVMSEVPRRISLNKGYTEEGFSERVFHIHLRYRGDNDELYFLKYLREHPAAAKEYESLKLSLWHKYEHDRDAYTEAKTAFISRVTEEAKREYPGFFRRKGNRSA